WHPNGGRMNTAIHTHVLSGCATQPLGAYLKAMGILRIVAEQADPEARGYWRHDGFILQTVLDRDALMNFFLNDWQPNPFLSPWNKGSGLLGTDKKGVEPLEQSIAPRFQRIRDGIAVTRSLTADMEAAVAAEKEVKGEKT